MIDDAGLIDEREPDDIESVADALIAERGGAGAFSVAQVAAARRLAMALCSEQPTGSNLAALLEMLPAREAGAPADLTLLTDKEFEFLDFALSKARGEPAVNPSREKRRKRSPRELEAVTLARLLDKIAGLKRQPSALEITEIKNGITAILYGAAPLVHVLFAQSIAGHEALLAPSPAPPSAPAVEPEAPAVLPGNVTRLPAREVIW